MHAGFGKRQRGRAKRAFRRQATDDPVRPSASGAIIDLLFAIDRMIAAPCRVMPHLQIAERLETCHVQSLSADLNGSTSQKFHRGRNLSAPKLPK